MVKELNKLFILAALVSTLAYAQDNHRPHGDKDLNQDDLNSKYVVEIISNPTERFTKNWCFVIDNSESVRDIFGQVRAGFLSIVNQNTDHMFFSAISFNNRGGERFRDWVAASPEEFAATDRWLTTCRGVLSYGVTALRMALTQERSELTVIILTDGGFTEACINRGNFGQITSVIEECQAWRENRGFGAAIICTIGIENIGYTIGNKPPDEVCQAYLRGLGERYGGGYILTRRR